jgi:hypothetical protein
MPPDVVLDLPGLCPFGKAEARYLYLFIYIYIYIGSTNTVEFYFTLNDRMTVIIAKTETVSPWNCSCQQAGCPAPEDT